MKVSIKWLEECLGSKLNLTVKELSDKLLKLGFEVSMVTPYPKCTGIVVSKILSISKHPNADRLRIAKVTDGTTPLEVVCGAPNISEGQVVPWARVGAVLAGGMKISETAIRGVKSPGMLCSLKELGLGENHSGIWVLSEKMPLGAPLEGMVPFEDTVLNIEVTPNRPDCLSVIGIARELAATLDLKSPQADKKYLDHGSLPYYPLAIDDLEGCSRYIAKLFKDVKILSSPPSVQARLIRSGVRPINNAVDITNMVMMETGQPLHVFDADKIEGGKIIVRRAKDKEKILALDGVTYTLDPEILVIADTKKAIAIAGVMGGEATAVTDNTKNILLESAIFNRERVRLARKKLNLSSESSYRFERGVTKWSCEAGSQRAEELLKELCSGKLVSYSNSLATPKQTKPESVSVRVTEVERILGEKMSPTDMATTFRKLGISVASKDEAGLKLERPDWRVDLIQEIDFIEEIARLKGYDHYSSNGIKVELSTISDQSSNYSLTNRAKTIIQSMGFQETVHYGLVSKKDISNIINGKDCIEIQNPLSQDQELMRPTLLLELIKSVKENRAYQKKNIRLYEVGRVFQKLNGHMTEELRIGGVACGEQSLPSWKKRNSEKADLHWMRGVVQALCEKFGLTDQTVTLQKNDGKGNSGRLAFPSSYQLLHPSQSFQVVTYNGDKKSTIGIIGSLHPRYIKQNDLDSSTVVFELDFEKILSNPSVKKFQKISLFPSIERDCTLWLNESVQWNEVLSEIQKGGGNLLKACRLFDIYRDKNEPDQKSLSFTLTFQHEDKTLEDETANSLRDKIVSSLEKRFGAKMKKK